MIWGFGLGRALGAAARFPGWLAALRGEDAAPVLTEAEPALFAEAGLAVLDEAGAPLLAQAPGALLLEWR